MNFVLRPGLKDVARSFLSEEDSEKFARWAFGEDYLIFDELIQFAKAWNHLHGDLYHLDYVKSPSKDMAKMIELWRENEPRT